MLLTIVNPTETSALPVSRYIVVKSRITIRILYVTALVIDLFRVTVLILFHNLSHSFQAEECFRVIVSLRFSSSRL